MTNHSSSLSDLETLFQKHGFDDYRWVNPKDIVVSQWVRMKCMYGCSTYGKKATCPPNNPSVSECREFFDEYSDIAVFHFEMEVDNPDKRYEQMEPINQKLLDLEREVFLSGYVKAFLFFANPCSLCSDCASKKDDCKQPKLGRPAPEGFAVDVFSTVKALGYPISVLKDYHEKMNRYAFLLVR
ncbi:MAG: DUF2284 domain-containing protein [Candidatus Thorarchaeota archaeon]|jgi:predicted metal-binding protein